MNVSQRFLLVALGRGTTWDSYVLASAALCLVGWVLIVEPFASIGAHLWALVMLLIARHRPQWLE